MKRERKESIILIPISLQQYKWFQARFLQYIINHPIKQSQNGNAERSPSAPNLPRIRQRCASPFEETWIATCRSPKSGLRSWAREMRTDNWVCVINDLINDFLFSSRKLIGLYNSLPPSIVISSSRHCMIYSINLFLGSLSECLPRMWTTNFVGMDHIVAKARRKNWKSC